MTVGVIFIFQPTIWKQVVYNKWPSQSYSLSVQSVQQPSNILLSNQKQLSHKSERFLREQQYASSSDELKQSSTTMSDWETLSHNEQDEEPMPGVNTGILSSLSPTRTSNMGYWLVLHYSDQGTGAFVNLMTLLCLASAIGGVRVVEPFIFGSNIGQNASANWTEEISFSEIFDSENFHKFAQLRGYHSLVPYREFLTDASHKVLLVQYQCSGSKRCRRCGHRRVVEQGRTFSRMNGFKIAGHVCLEYGTDGTISLAELDNQLYPHYNKSEVVVIFPLFAGVSRFRAEGFRLWMQDTPNCQRKQMWNSISNIRPSKLVLASVDNYIQKYLKGESYMSVMVRFEIVIWSRNIMGPIVKTCLDRLHKKLDALKFQFSIKNIALCLDIGKYGTVFFRHNKPAMGTILPYVNNFISHTVQEGMTLLDWDNSFTTTAIRQNPAFVAVMQKTIAARGDLLVLLGEGSQFQDSTKSMFLVSHPEERVIHLSNSCF